MKAKIKKRRNVEEDDTSAVRIMFVLMNSDKYLTCSEIAKEAEMSATLAFHHLKYLKKGYLVMEDENKKYGCQQFFKDEDLIDDIDSLLIMILKIFSKNIDTEKTGDKKFFRAVLSNLKMYLEIFELTAE